MTAAPPARGVKRVAMLVHNGVLKDARVIKSATSLAEAGYLVEIHGVTTSDFPETLEVPGTGIPVFLEPRALLPESGHRPLTSGKKGRTRPNFARWVNRLERSARRTLTRLPWLRWRVLRLLRALSALSSGLDKRRAHPSPDTAAPRSVESAPRHLRPLINALMRSVGRRPEPAIYHLHDHVALTLASSLKARSGACIIWDAHEIYEDLAAENPVRSAQNAALIASQQHAVDACITISESIAGFYATKYSGLGVPHIVMNATFASPEPRYDGRLHAAAGLPASQKILLFQGGFAEHRGLRYLLAAAPLLNPDWTVVLMGWGALENELRALAAASPRGRGAPSVVFLPGVPHKELQQWSAGAALGAIPYENTGLNHLYCTPNKLWEYPDATVPILATDLEEMGRMIRDTGIGFLLPRQFNELDIARIVNAISDEALAESRQRCRRFIESNNWQTWVPNLLAAYEAAQAAPPRPRKD